MTSPPLAHLAASLVSKIVDPLIVLSFNRPGFLLHRATFDPSDLEVDLAGRVCLVTGANSGLGRAAATALARLGAEVWLLCRNAARGDEAARAIRAQTGSRRVLVAPIDLASLASVRAFAAGFDRPRVDVLVNNAGVLPATRTITPDGLETTFATNVVGPFLLTRLLLPKLLAAEQARVVNVSSGGMYTAKLSLDDLAYARRPFDGVAAYAQTKRAEVVLTELWSERLAGSSVHVNAMHPGWADTPAVRSSIPRFHRVMAPLLRAPEEGADTIVWLAACPRLAATSGLFFFDRRPVRTHLLPWTREAPEDRERLWGACCASAGVPDKLETEAAPPRRGA